jgi:hypothetical protein
VKVHYEVTRSVRVELDRVSPPWLLYFIAGIPALAWAQSKFPIGTVAPALSGEHCSDGGEESEAA